MLGFAAAKKVTKKRSLDSRDLRDVVCHPVKRWSVLADSFQLDSFLPITEMNFHDSIISVLLVYLFQF